MDGQPTHSGSAVTTAHCLRYLTDIFRVVHTAALVREPLRDKYCPDTGDLDVIVVGDYSELLPERMPVPKGYPPIDLIRLPLAGFTDLENLSMQGVIPHRLLSSKLVCDPDNSLDPQLATLRELMYRHDLQRQRIAGLMDLGYHAVREVGVTRDLPELALFWLHMAFASLMAALGDACEILCPNIYTRPFDYIDELQNISNIELDDASEMLGVCDDIDELGEVLWQMHAIVTTRFPEPDWPAQMRQCTRHEYRYFSTADELQWRLAAASELDTHLNNSAAIFYLRFMAYMLACVPIVHHRALEGIDVSFIRPQRAVGPDLKQHAPQIVPLLKRALGGEALTSELKLDNALRWVQSLKDRVEQHLLQRGLAPIQSRAWKPYKPKVAS